MTDYVWVTDPPIVHVPTNQVAARVQLFRQNVADWGNPGGDRWTARLGATGHISALAGTHGSEGRHDRPTFEYRMDGQPIALMVLYLRSDGVIEIKDLVTHPGSANAGGIMVEFALNKVGDYNQQLKHEVFASGVVILESYDDDSTAAYEALGFEKDGKDMYVNANKSDLWEKHDGAWKLAKYAQLNYMNIA